MSGKLNDVKLFVDIGQTVTNIGGAIFDRIKKIKDMGDRITKLEGDVKELKDKK